MKLKMLIGLALLAASGVANAAPVAAIAMMAGAIAEAGTLAAVFTSFATGASFIGGAVSLVGQISGDKNLVKIGSVIGLAGAGAGLIQGLAGGAASGAASATQPGAQAIEAAAQTGVDAAQLVETAGVTQPGAQAIEAAAKAGASPLTQMPGAQIADVAQPSAGLAGAGAPTGAAGDVSSMIQPGAQKIEQLAGTAGKAAESGGGIIDTFGRGVKWLEERPTLAKYGSAIIGGAADAYGEQAAQQGQMDYFDRLRAQYSASITGMNPVGTFVNPNATVTRGPVQNPVGRWAPGTPPPVVPPTRG